jgi:protein SCO1/2
MFTLPIHPFCFCLAAVCCLVGVSYGSDSEDALPERLNGVAIEEFLDIEVPLDVDFMDETGAPFTFGGLLKDGKPVILTLNYSDCPGLCVAQLNGLSKGINGLGSLSLGKDFKMVSLSIDPKESKARSASTKAKYAESLEDHHEVSGWRFLTGSEKNIQLIANTVGFRYTYDAKHNRYNHGAAAIFISPKGRVTRYLYEVGFTPETLKMALVEAGEGRIGSPLDSIVLWCYHYNANENRYSANAKMILAVAAGLFLTVGLSISLPFWLSKRRRGGTISHAAPA